MKLTEQLRQRLQAYIDRNYREELVGRLLQPAAPRIAGVAEPELDDCFILGREESVKVSSLEEMLKQVDAGFTETLLTLIDCSGKKDSQIYKKANLSRQHFSKIRNDPCYRPTKPTALALALALELDMDGIRDLIGRAGYALTNSSKFDLIIRFFVEQGNYDITQINIALYEFDQPLLGA